MARDAELERYCGVIEGALRASLPAQAYGGDGREDLRVERGVAYPLLLLGGEERSKWTGREIEALLTLPAKGVAVDVPVLDANGHRRPVYAGLLAYSAFRVFSLPGGRWGREDVERWEGWADAKFAVSRWPADGSGMLPAAEGAAAVESIWLALALATGDESHDGPEERVSDAFEALVKAQRPSGTFLEAGASDNPETHWYHELLLLHAAASYAAVTRDPAVEAAVARAAAFHLYETQPDHATNQPWALAAFARHAETRPVADGMLHAAATIGRRSALTSILLADALYCLRLWMA